MDPQSVERPPSVLLAHRMQGHPVLVVGGGVVAQQRLEKLVPTGARVTLVADHFTAAVEQTALQCPQQVRLVRERYRESHLNLEPYWRLILVCLPSGAANHSDDAKGQSKSESDSEKVYRDAKRVFGAQQSVNVADVPALCDFYFGADTSGCPTGKGEGQLGSMQLLVSSNGVAPRYAALVRDELVRHLGELPLAQSLDRLDELRAAVREEAPGPEMVAVRMDWVCALTDRLGLRGAASMDVQEELKKFKDYCKERGEQVKSPSQDN
ncbi:bifunctional precorrin-2 dehydrogenase/sirohydrochlorin ferrochelatase MET8 KNAG_0M00860 [Huiozyma naganishii CBS 8797]|uniref:precorrin-2 dehydrogenase n=1 Tax=Huiozyma naganishii (strain ATCC MYA-139 / BCRC 22969 / CBS 8797 / KCTC 17520 / NBRC 10181 / NCYC 3082 / Yp74L-3) TaxID=1071383 RepID=J7SAQ2_HUIN7|nr:hypothetical protein KNAG_0M00860 [Kazachstania naganishii CBS 8797]CCK72939.1 hypothetical protein KNAG_0M00860 [Kazachstania naganishii CBS 8797]